MANAWDPRFASFFNVASPTERGGSGVRRHGSGDFQGIHQADECVRLRADELQREDEGIELVRLWEQMPLRRPYRLVIGIFMDQARQDQPLTIHGDGQQTRDFISVHDIARANVIAATKPGIPSGAANICTGSMSLSKNRFKLLGSV